jgi:hypothetical protein
MGLASILVALSFSAARADIGVVVTGEATLQPQLAAQLEGWLKRRGHTVAVSPLEPDAINTLIDCFVIDDLNCARAVVEKRTTSRAIIFVRAAIAPDESSGSRNITIVGYWLQKGHETIGERRNCRRCTEEQLRVAADDLMHALASEPPASSYVPDPAKHAAQLQQTTPATDSPTRRSRLIPGIAIAGGVALALAGGVLIAVDQDPADIPRSGAQPANFRDTALPGAICIGAGVAAITTGAFLWFRGGDSSRAVATVSDHSALIGWAGQF